MPLRAPVMSPTAEPAQWLRVVAPSIVLVMSTIALSVLGLLVLYSVGRSPSAGAAQVFNRQLLWFLAAGVAFLLAWRIPLEWMRRLVWPIGLLSLGLLVAVLIPGVGVMVNGARRWLDLGPMNLQVSDFAKIGMVFVLAHYLATQQRHRGTFLLGYVVPCAIFGAVFFLILLQPDYGTALLCAVVGATLLFLAGGRLLYMIPTGFAGMALFGLAVLQDPVRLQRILVFLDVEGNRSGGAYQLWQATLAYGVGGIGGVGLGNGRQQLAFLPEAHTDFIFPIIGEELGLIFTAGVVLLFLLMFLVVSLRLREAPNLFHFLLVSGALLLITLQAMINFGVATGLLPTKGLSLPFISYGGSNLVATYLLLGLILNSFRHWNQPLSHSAKEVTA